MNRARSRRRGKKNRARDLIVDSLKKKYVHTDDSKAFKIWSTDQLEESLWAAWINEKLGIAVLLNRPLFAWFYWGDVVSVKTIKRTHHTTYGRYTEYHIINKLLKRFR